MHLNSLRARVSALLLVTAAATLLPSAAQAAQPAQVPDGACTDPTGVTVVVDLTDLGGEIEVGCAVAPATGTAALQAAGFVDTRDASGLICAIDALPDPCPATFEGSYWSYWYATPGGEWQSYLEGSDTAVPAPGAVEGWRYSDGSAGPGIVPPGATDEATVGETDEATEEESEESAEATEEVTAVTTDPVEPAGDVTPLVVAGIGVVALAGLAGVLLVRRRRTLHQD